MATELPDPDEESCLAVIAETEKEFGPFEPEYRKQLLQDLLKRAKEMRTYLEDTEPDPFWTAHHEAKRLEQCGEWQDALAIYTELLATEGWPIKWYFLTWQEVSRVQFLLNNFAESLTAAQEAIRCFRSPEFEGPPLDNPLAWESHLLLRNGRVEEAAERIQEMAAAAQLDQSVTRQTTIASLLYLQGLLAIATGELPKAVTICNSLKELAEERFHANSFFPQLDIQVRIRSLTARRLQKLQDYSAATDTWQAALDLFKNCLSNPEIADGWPELKLTASEIAFHLYEALRTSGRTEEAAKALAEYQGWRKEFHLPLLA